MALKNFWYPNLKNGKTYIIAEGGINAAGNVECAKLMIDMAATCGCNAIKWQKRTPAIAVPEDQKSKIRQTPDGPMTYLEYKEKTEFSIDDCRQLFEHAKSRNIDQSFSVWDLESFHYIINAFNPYLKWVKIPSCLITNRKLCHNIFEWAYNFDRQVIVSTGMSTLEEIDQLFNWFKISQCDPDQLVMLHCNSSYPAKTSELNLNCISTLKERYGLKNVGFSNHDIRVIPAIASVYKGATHIEVHIALSHEMWGTDIQSSYELGGLYNLVTGVRLLEQAEGDGVKTLYDSEIPYREKLRGN